MEIWKDINGYEGIYQVSSYGRVKALPRKVISGINNTSIRYTCEKILKLNVDSKNKYMYIDFKVNGIRSRFSVHRLVLCTFSPNSNSKYLEVNHLDLNTKNNRLDNLEWVTSSENKQHSIKMRGK